MLLPTIQFIIVPNWAASFTTPKINFWPSLRAQVIINRMTSTGSKIEMFIKLPFKLTVICDVGMYYHQRILGLFVKAGHRQHSKEGIQEVRVSWGPGWLWRCLFCFWFLPQCCRAVLRVYHPSFAVYLPPLGIYGSRGAPTPAPDPASSWGHDSIIDSSLNHPHPFSFHHSPRLITIRGC